MSSRIVVADGGESGALGALRTARWLAVRKDARVEVLAITEPSDYYRMPLDGESGSETPSVPRGVLEVARRRIHVRLDEAGFGDGDSSVDVEYGPFAPTVLRTAVRRRATHVVADLPPVGASGMAGRERLQSVVQLAHVPVLAVPAEVSALPERALVAIDFSRFSVHAAWEAARCLDRRGRLDLVHVLCKPSVEAESWDFRHRWAERYVPSVRRRLEGLASTLESIGNVSVRTHLVSGEPAAAVLSLVEELGSDLLALGSHGQGYIGRTVMGRTSMRLLHTAGTALLVVPPTGIPAELVRDAQTAELVMAEQELEYSGIVAAVATAQRSSENLPFRRRGHEPGGKPHREPVRTVAESSHVAERAVGPPALARHGR